MIKLKSLIKEVGTTSNKDEETITIKHKTSEKEIVIVDTLKNRKKYTKMGYIIPLPKHLQKLIKDLEKRDKEFSKYGVEVTDVIVPGLEWMADIKEGKLLLVGGGTGLVPMMRLLTFVKPTDDVTILIGAKSKKNTGIAFGS